jgi:Integrase core domain
MLFSLLYFLVRRLLGVGGRRADEKDIELLVLRHQVKVLQRQVSRPRLNRLDRVLFAAASRAMTSSRSSSSFMVRPETLLRWHRELVANAFAERFVRTVRREGLDHVLIYGRRHLERVLQTYVAHYLHERPHRGLGLAVPAGNRAPQNRRATQTPVERRDVLGGLIHEYRRAA